MDSFTDNWELFSLFGRLKNLCVSLARWTAIVMTTYHIYTSIFGLPSAKQHRAIHLGLAMVIAFSSIPILERMKENRKYSLIVDFSLILLSIFTMGYIVNQYVAIAYRVGDPTQMDIVLGVIATLLILEFARRVVGLQLLIVPIAFLLYLFFGQYVPGFLGHRPFSIARMVNTVFLSTDGIFGAPLGASSIYVAVFVILGSIFELTGLGEFFINLAYSLTGRSSSGPAQTAVLASGLFGMISGSPSANVVTTGTFTIPLMKSVGYKAESAGAIEALASVGGQIMPPIMGASAFIIAETLEIPYLSIVTAAFIPAILYYVSAAISVHLQAKKRGIKPKLADIGNPLVIIKEGWFYLIPISVLLFLLIIVRYSPYRSAIVCIFTTFAISILKNTFKFNLKNILYAFEISSKKLLTIVSACAASGIVIGVVTLTGLGLKISMVLMDLTKGNLLFALIISQIAAMIMGMGLPTAAAYITTSVLLAPALVKLGLPPLSAHLFIFYGAIVSNLTPPVCIASYAAAGVAKSDPWKTAIEGFLLGLPGPYLVPYIFIYRPSLLLFNAPSKIFVILNFFIGLLAVSCLAISLRGYLFAKLNIIERIIAVIASILFVIDNYYFSIYAVILLILLIFIQIIKRRKQLVSN